MLQSTDYITPCRVKVPCIGGGTVLLIDAGIINLLEQKNASGVVMVV